MEKATVVAIKAVTEEMKKNKGEIVMIIAIPVEEKNINKEVCVSFGRTPYFLIFNTQTGEEKYIINAAAESQGGAGIKAAQIVIDAGATSVIIPRLGQNAADVLNSGNMKIYKSEYGSVKHNIELLIENKLSPLTTFHAGFHGRGGF